MEKNIIISGKEIIESKKATLNTFKQIKIFVVDKNGNEGFLLSSLLNEKDMANYEKDILKLFNCTNWMQLKYSANPIVAKAIFDNEKKNSLAGIETEFGLLLKNEIRFY